MYIKLPSKRRNKFGWTLVEIMVATGLFSLSSIALGTIFIFSIKSFASMANYASLDRDNRSAMDTITREIRQAKLVTGYVTNAGGNTLSIRNGDGQNVAYSFDSANHQFIRTVNGFSQLLLSDCNLLSFNLFQRLHSQTISACFQSLTATTPKCKSGPIDLEDLPQDSRRPSEQ
jgi:Tfp pilus assembly protein PilW